MPAVRYSSSSGEYGVIDRTARHDVAVAGVRWLSSLFLVFRLHHRKAIALQVQHRFLWLDVVEPRVVAAEDRGLDCALRVAERSVAIFLLHRLGNFQAAQAFDLPLRAAGPQRVGAPADAIDAEPLDQGPH